MSSFLDFLSVYAIWIYLLGAIGILFAIKMLIDSRRQARTTMFTLEQEQASDQAFRALLWLVGFIALIGGVSAVNAFISPGRPTPVPAIAKETIVYYTPPLIAPTFTTVPTLTPVAPTATPTQTREVQRTPANPVATQPAPPPPPPKTDTPESVFAYPKPNLNTPRSNDTIIGSQVHFAWGVGQLPAQLPPGQFYKITLVWSDRDTKAEMVQPKCVSNNGLDSKIWGGRVSDAQGRAVEDHFTWYVVVFQAASDYECDAGGGSAISPPSDTWPFLWR